MKKDHPVCNVAGKTYFGTELEAVAAKLEKGAKVNFNGSEETVESVFFYEGLIIRLASGGAIFPALGDIFEVNI